MGYKAPKVDVRYCAPLEPVFELLDGGEIGTQITSGLDELGRELPDGVPMAPPVGYKSGPTLQDTILHMLRHQTLRAAADAEGFDSPEEADDFNIEDDPLDPATEYEAEFFSEDELRSRLTEYDSRFRKKPPAKEAGEDGNTEPDERRVVDDNGSPRGGDKVVKGKSVKKSNANDERSVSEADSSASGSDE